MSSRLAGVLALVVSIADWFFRETIKAWFFERVVHTMTPADSSLVEFGPPLVLGGIGLYLLWRASERRQPVSGRRMLSVALMIGGCAVFILGAFVFRADTGHFPFFGGDEAHDGGPKKSESEQLHGSRNPEPQPKKTGGLDGTIKLECLTEAFQLPSDGKLWELVVSDNQARTIGFQSHWLSEFAYKSNPSVIPTRFGMIDKCRMTNFGTIPVFNIRITAEVEFSEHIPIAPKMTEQRRVDLKKYQFVIPQLDPGPNGHVDFYLFNHTKFLVTTTLDRNVELQKLGTTERESATLIPAHTLVALWPPPQPPDVGSFRYVTFIAEVQRNITSKSTSVQPMVEVVNSGSGLLRYHARLQGDVGGKTAPNGGIVEFEGILAPSETKRLMYARIFDAPANENPDDNTPVLSGHLTYDVRYWADGVEAVKRRTSKHIAFDAWRPFTGKPTVDAPRELKITVGLSEEVEE